jgi:glycosyltransferase involved in cell wall biosynthesis
MKNVLILKDVDFISIQNTMKSEFGLSKEDIHIINFSDFYTSRLEQIKFIRSLKAERFILGFYKKKYIKWSIVFYIFLFLTNSKKKYLIDTDNYVEKVTFLVLIKNIVKSIFSFIIQSLYLFKITLILLEHYLKPKTKLKKLGDSNELSGIYLRTNDSYNLLSGGSLGHTLGVIDGLKSHCKEVIYFGNDKINGIDKSIKQVIIEPSEFFNLVNFTNRTIFSEIFSKKIIKKLKKIKSDFIYQRLSRDDISGAIISRALKIPLVVEYNSSMEWELINSSLYFEKMLLFFTNRLERIMLNQASLIVVVSNVLKEELLSKGYDKSKIMVVPNGVDTNKFNSNIDNDLIEKLNLSKDKITVGFSGTFGFWHGVDTLEESIKLINNSERINCQFLMIGDGFYRKQMQNNLQEYNNIIFTKNVPYTEVVNYLSLCDIFISPHSLKNEEKFIGSPTKLFEYMSMSKIIIASNLDQIAEIISPSLKVKNINSDFIVNFDSKDSVGITFDQGNQEQLAYAIEFAVKNFEKLNYLGNNAREKAIKNYQWNNLTKSILVKIIEDNKIK